MSSAPTTVAFHCPSAWCDEAIAIVLSMSISQPYIQPSPSEQPGSFPALEFRMRELESRSSKPHTLALVGHGIVAWHSHPFPADADADAKCKRKCKYSLLRLIRAQSHSAEWPASQCNNPEIDTIRARSSPATTGAGVHRLSMLPLAWIKERVMTFKDMGAGAPPTQQRILRYTCHTARNQLGEHARKCIVTQVCSSQSVEINNGAGRAVRQLTTGTTSSCTSDPPTSLLRQNN